MDKSKEKKPMIEVWSLQCMGLLIPCPSGVFYSNQTTGVLCMHPAVEGVFVPLDSDDASEAGIPRGPARKLFDYFDGSPHGGAGAPCGLETEDADIIDSVLRDAQLLEVMEVDRTRLSESHEAWVYVRILKDYDHVFSGFEPYPREGILTWPNTD